MLRDRLDEQLTYVCEIKAQELAMLGYEAAAEDVWACVSAGYKEMPPLHKAVNDILTLKPGRWMNWLTMRMYKNESM
ncbi:hypothetical protein JQN58_05690 [Aneurinibacillus sp. BA2021]|nr:hypothetical protein [Aneurinibacillus sp. BA2021]